MESHKCQATGGIQAIRSGGFLGVAVGVGWLLEECPLAPHPSRKRPGGVFQSQSPKKQEQEEITVTLQPGRNLGMGTVWAHSVAGVREKREGGWQRA